MTWRRWLWRYRDPVIAGVSATGLAGELLLYDSSVGIGAVALAVVAGVSLYWRRTQPVLSFIAAWLGLMSLAGVAGDFDGESTTFVIVFFLTLFSLGAHTRGREISVAVLLVGIGVAVFAYTDSDKLAFGDIVFGTIFVGGPWATGLAIRLRGDIARSHALLEREQEERERRAVTEERSRIARELHDVVSHAISVTVLQARGARRVLDSDPDAARDALGAIERTNTAALGDMRRLLAVLRDTEEDAAEHAPQPTLAGLGSLVDRVRASGLAVELDVRGSERDLPPGVDLSAYRIVQEALTNVLKHSADATARITLEYGDAALAVSVEDDGTPRLNGDSAPGHGLIGIRERVAVVGGEVETGAAPGGGYRVRARLPYSLEVS